MFTRKTVWLAGVALVLLALNLVDRGNRARVESALPTLPAVDREAVTRIEVSNAVTKVVLEKFDETAGDKKQSVWHITAPIEADADQIAIKELLKVFRKETPMDARVDRGNLDDYGLDPGNGIVFEAWEGEGEPVLSFTVGKDAGGGASFIRLSGDDAVYRARVGGRHRYDKKPSEWRNRLLMGFDKNHASAIEVVQGGRVTLHVVRGEPRGTDHDGEPIPGDWAFEPEQPFQPDQLALDALAKGLGTLKAGEILGSDFDGGFDPPRAEVRVTLDDGSERVLVVGSRVLEGSTFVRVPGKDDVFRVARAPVERALLPYAEYRDKTMFLFSRKDLDTIALERGRETVLLQQDLSNGFWTVLEPKNIDIDLKNVFFAVNTLAELRAHEVSELDRAAAGLAPPRARIVLQFLDGHSESLEIGNPVRDHEGRPAWATRVAGRSEVFLLRDDTMKRILAGFGVAEP